MASSYLANFCLVISYRAPLIIILKSIILGAFLTLHKCGILLSKKYILNLELLKDLFVFLAFKSMKITKTKCEQKLMIGQVHAMIPRIIGE